MNELSNSLRDLAESSSGVKSDYMGNIITACFSHNDVRGDMKKERHDSPRIR